MKPPTTSIFDDSLKNCNSSTVLVTMKEWCSTYSVVSLLSLSFVFAAPPIVQYYKLLLLPQPESVQQT